jgi:hypothetical protein
MRPVPTLLVALLGTGCMQGQANLSDGGDGGPRCANLTSQVTVSPSAIDFGAVVAGTMATQIATVTNCTVNDEVVTPRLQGPQAEFFQISTTVPFRVKAGASVPLSVTYAPRTFSAMDSATVELVFDNGDSATLPLQGIAGAFVGCAGGTRQSSVTPQAIEFGNVIVKTTATQLVTVTNCTQHDIMVTPSATRGPEAALFQLGRTAPFTAGAGISVGFNVIYAPLVPSKLDAAWFELVPDTGAPVLLTLQGAALQSGLEITPLPLNFSFVQPGNSVTLPLHLTNVGSERITVTSVSIVDPGTLVAYSLVAGAWTGGDLSPGDSQDVVVSFTPSELTPYTGELDISSTDTASLVPVTLLGWGGGAQISCSPVSLDFETVAATTGSSLSVSCTNTGSDVPDHPEAGLIFSTLLTDNPVFSAQVDPTSVNQASWASPLAAGQSVQLDVIYTPTDAGTDVGLLKINSNATDGTSLTPPAIALTGTAIVEEGCNYAVTPWTVDFGQVQVGSKYDAGFVITNTGPDACLVTGLNLSAGTPTAWTLTSGPVVSQRLSPPQTPPGPYPTQLDLQLEFAPTQAGSYSGAVQWTLSDSQAPHQTVVLAGAATE